MAYDDMSTSNVSGCSGNSFTASSIVRLFTANVPSPSASSSCSWVVMTFSLSDAVIVSVPPATSNK